MRLKTVGKIVIALVVVVVAAVVIALFTIDFSRFKGVIADRVSTATGRKLAISGDFHLSLLPLPALAVKGVSFANAPWGTRPQMATVGELDVEVAVLPLLFGGNLQIREIVLKDVDLLLETDAKGEGNWQFTAAGASAATPAATPAANGAPARAPAPAPVAGQAAPAGSRGFVLPEVDRIEMQNVAVGYRDGKSGKTTHAALKSLKLTSSGGGPIALAIAASYGGTPIGLNAKLGPLADLNGAKPYAVDATLTAAGLTLTLKGTVAQPLQGRGLDLAVGADDSDLKPLGALIDVALPAGQPLHLRGQVTGGAGGPLHVAGLDFTFGPSDLAGDLTYDPGSARPRLSGHLTAKTIDLTALPGGTSSAGAAAGTGAKPGAAPAKAPAPAAAKGGGSQRMFSTTPIDFSALGDLDADITFTAAHVKSAAAALDGVSAHLVLNDRDLALKPISGIANGNHFAGDLLLAARDPQPKLTLDLDAKGLDVGALLKQASGKDMLAAKGDLAVAVTGSGRSLAAIMGSLDGKTSLVIGRGTLNIRYADLLGTDVVRQILPFIGHTNDSQLNCAVGRFDIRRGIATADALVVDTGLMTMRGQGTVDLGTEKLALLLTPSPKDVGLISLAVPIRVGGTLTHPTYSPDATAVAKGVAGAIVGNAINPLGALLPLVAKSVGGSSASAGNPCLVAAAAKSGGTGAAAGQSQTAPSKSSGSARAIRGLFKSLPFGSH